MVDGSVDLVLAEASPTSLLFVGPADGFPATVRYTRAGNLLTVEETGMHQGQPRTFTERFRTDLDLNDIARNLDRTFKDVASTLDGN